MKVRVGLGLGLGRGDGVRAEVVTSGLVRLLAVILARLGEGACSDPLLAFALPLRDPFSYARVPVLVRGRVRVRVRVWVRVWVRVRVEVHDDV